MRLVVPRVHPRASGPLPLSQGIKWREAEKARFGGNWKWMDGIGGGPSSYRVDGPIRNSLFLIWAKGEGEVSPSRTPIFKKWSGNEKAIWGSGPVSKRKNSCAGLVIWNLIIWFSEIVVIWLNAHVQSKSSCKTTLYPYVRNSSCSSGIQVLRIQLQLGVHMLTTRYDSLLSNFSRWFSLFHRYLLGQISMILPIFRIQNRIEPKIETWILGSNHN